MKTIWNLILIFGVSFVRTNAQNYQIIDSLKRQLSIATEDTIKGLTIWALLSEYTYTKPDSALYYVGLGLQLITDPAIKQKFAHSSSILSSFEVRMYRVGAAALAEQRNDSLAVRMGLKSLELAEKSKDKYDIPRAYFGLSEMYQFIGEVGLAIDYMKKYLPLDTSADGRAVATVSLGTCYYDAGQYDSAMYYLKKIDPKYKLNGEKYWPFPHLYLAKTYAKTGEYTKAFYEYGVAIKYARQEFITIDLLNSYIGVAETYKNVSKLDSALFYAKQGLQIANQIALPEQQLQASILLNSLYDSKGLTDSAYKYAKISLALKDSLFNTEKIKQVQNYTFNEKFRQQETQQAKQELQSKIKLYSLLAALTTFLVIALVLYRNNRYKQQANVLLQQQKDKVESTLSELKSAQAQLIQSEKMASLGELTAGIAHEIQNPLNFVNNFAEVNKELLAEMSNEITKGNYSEVRALAQDVINNEEKVSEHGKRADAIVKGMLQHSRTSSGHKELTDIKALCDEYLRLAYQGFRARDKTFNATFTTEFDNSIDKVNIVPQDIGRVILNLINNAFYAVNEKAKEGVPGYEPTVIVTTGRLQDKIEVRVKDNGNGIPSGIKEKIFQPFFTTKPTGQGTGLGLSLAYDIVKAHGGEIKVETKEGEGTQFIVRLPV